MIMRKRLAVELAEGMHVRTNSGTAERSTAPVDDRLIGVTETVVSSVEIPITRSEIENAVNRAEWCNGNFRATH